MKRQELAFPKFKMPPEDPAEVEACKEMIRLYVPCIVSNADCRYASRRKRGEDGYEFVTDPCHDKTRGSGGTSFYFVETGC